jgi:hypothetical protein
MTSETTQREPPPGWEVRASGHEWQAVNPRGGSLYAADRDDAIYLAWLVEREYQRMEGAR